MTLWVAIGHVFFFFAPLVAALLQGHADGIIVLDGSLPSATVEAIQRAGIPVVAHGYEDDTAVPKVEPDFHQGVRLAVDHLADLGHTRIGYLSPKSPQTDLRRFRAIRGALAVGRWHRVRITGLSLSLG